MRSLAITLALLVFLPYQAQARKNNSEIYMHDVQVLKNARRLEDQGWRERKAAAKEWNAYKNATSRKDKRKKNAALEEWNKANKKVKDNSDIRLQFVRIYDGAAFNVYEMLNANSSLRSAVSRFISRTKKVSPSSFSSNITINNVDGEQFIIILPDDQVAFYFNYGKMSSFVISSAAGGFSNSRNSGKSPTGLMKVSRIVDGDMNEDIVNRWPTGESVKIEKDDPWLRTPQEKRPFAKMTTKLLVLSGLESSNSNVRSRSIYFHGTNHEFNLCRPASHGCFRTSNDLVELLAKYVPVGTLVFVP